MAFRVKPQKLLDLVKTCYLLYALLDAGFMRPLFSLFCFKYSTISCLVIFANFALNLSFCSRANLIASKPFIALVSIIHKFSW